MANIESIKQKILQLDAGTFQNLCDSYLCKIGYSNIVSLGGEAGTRKTTYGTPDTYFITYSVSGPQTWRTKDGRTLKDIENGQTD